MLTQNKITFSMPLVGSFAFFNSASIGCFFVLIGWQAATISEGAGLIGRVFLTGSLTNIFLSPVLGYVAENGERQRLLIASQLITVVVGFLPLVLFVVLQVPANELILHVLMFAFSALFNFSRFCLAPIMRDNFNSNAFSKLFSMISLGRKGGFALGSFIGGYLMTYLDFYVSFAALNVFLLASILLSSQFPQSRPAKEQPIKQYNALKQFKGFLEVVGHKNLLFYTVLWVVFSSIAAFINTVLPDYVETVLQQTSTFYGWVETAGGLGGVLISVVVMYYPSIAVKASRNPAIFIAGVSFLVLALSSNQALFVFIHFVLGAGVAYVNIIASAKITESCDSDKLASFFATVTSLASAAGVAVYILPSFIAFTNYNLVYGLAGVLLLIVAFAVRPYVKPSG